MPRPKLPILFGIGLNKTGTTSLEAACEIIGYRTLHYKTRRLSSAQIKAEVSRAVAEGIDPFTFVPELRKYNAFFDVRAVEQNYPALDAHYPNAKFLLHVRDIEPWLDSREKHFHRHSVRGTTVWTAVDREGWRKEYETHYSQARAYFAARPTDFLEIDITKESRWEPICEFLGVPVPNRPFPHQNRASDTRLERIRQRTRMRLRRIGIR